MYRHSELRACRYDVIIRSIFAKILKRRNCPRCFLYFVEDDQGIMRRHPYARLQIDGHQYPLDV